MAVADRFNSTGTIKSVALSENDAGGWSEAETSLITSYKYRTFPKTPHAQQLVRVAEGLEPNADVIFVMGVYDSRIQRGMILVDATDTTKRYKILGVDPQAGVGGRINHTAMSAVQKVRTTAEA